MKKAISTLLILAAIMPLYTACSENAADPAAEQEQTAHTANPAQTAETEPEEEIRYKANVPEGTDFEGMSFTVLTFPSDNSIWYDVDWSAEEMTGEAINDAVYTRTVNTESALNIDIKYVNLPSRGDTSTLQKSITAQDDAYQLSANTLESTFSMSQSGLVAELNDYAAKGTLDLEAEWWDANALKDLSITHKNYMLTGDIGTMYKKSIGVIMFNKAIHEDYQLDDPYVLMSENKWTIDTMVEMGTKVSEDLDGDGAMTDKDRYGLICFCDMMGLAMIGCDVPMATKDENDIPVITVYSEKSVSVIEKLATLMYDNNITWSWSKAGTGEEPAFEMYQQDQSLFYYGELHAVATMRVMDSPFGIMPMPLYDETQSGYHHCVNPGVAAVYSIPISNTEYEKTGYIMDTLGAESKNELTPAYYEVTLLGKVSRDVESTRSLDIIINTIKYDIGYVGGFNISTMLNKMADAHNKDLASQYQRQSKVFEKLITNMVKKYTD